MALHDSTHLKSILQENGSNEEKEEESPDVSQEPSDGSDSEDNDNTDGLQVQHEEEQEAKAKSCDSGSSVPSQQYVEDMEAVIVGASPTQNQLFANQGIFSGQAQSSRGQRTGPMITEIITEGGTCNYL